MAFYDEMAALSTELLTEFGQSAVVAKVTGSTYDPATSATVETTTDYNVKAALFDYGAENSYNMLVEMGDKQCLIQPGVVVPALADRVTIDGALWKIVNVKEVNPAGTACLYDCQVRK